MDQSIITDIGFQAITDAIATNTKISPSYFKVSYDVVPLDPTWTDIPNPVLQKPINAWFKVSDNEFRLYSHILNTEVTQPVSIIGIYDNQDRLLFVSKLDPPVNVNQEVYLENRYVLSNFESIIDFTEVPWDEYEQSMLIIDVLTKYGQLITDHTTYEIALKDLEARIIALETTNIDAAIDAHNLDINAHIPIQSAMNKAGIYVDPVDFEYVGQFWDENPSFDVNVVDDMLVYKDVDGLYKLALDNNTIQSKVIGIAKPSLNRVIATGFINISQQPNVSSFNVGDDLFLSDTNPGEIVNIPTNIKVGIYLGNNIMYLGSSISSGTSSTTTQFVDFEDLTYYLLLTSKPYLDLYYDKFSVDGTITITAGTATYDSTNTNYSVSAGTTIETPDLINDGNTYYRFLIHVESDVPPDVVEYSTDSGTTWNVGTLDETILVSTGFTTVRLRFTWNTNAVVHSYGILYNFSFEKFTGPDTRMFEIWVADTFYPAGSNITLPNGATYSVTNKDLEIYLNRVRLIPGVDYNEVDSRTVQFLVDINQNDVVIFTEKWGYVDTSIENFNKLNGAFVFNTDNTLSYVYIRDQVDGALLRLSVQNRSIVIEVV